MVENVKYPYRRFLVFSVVDGLPVLRAIPPSFYRCHCYTTIAERQAALLSIFVAVLSVNHK